MTKRSDLKVAARGAAAGSRPRVGRAKVKQRDDAAKSKRPKNAARQPPKLAIHTLPTGVRGLDDILGGGIPEFSFNIIAAAPDCGKTTLCLLYTSPSPRDGLLSRMPSSA